MTGVLVWTFTKMYHKKLWWCACISVLERRRQLDLWGSLANQPDRAGKPQALVIGTVSKTEVDSI